VAIRGYAARPLPIEVVSKIETTAKPKTVPERLSTWAPLFISALALATSIWSAYQSRVHNYQSVRPIIMVSGVASRLNPISGIIIQNNGAGAAILDRLEVRFNNKNVSLESVAKLINTMLSGPVSASVFTIPPKGLAIRSGEDIYLIKLPSDAIKDINAVNEIFQELRVEVRYCSIYRECFDSTF
jgi:hypothetical protein